MTRSTHGHRCAPSPRNASHRPETKATLLAEALESRLMLAGLIEGVVIEESTLAPIVGVAVYLDQNQDGTPQLTEPRAWTDEQGRYRFESAPAGEVIVRLVLPPQWRQISPADPSRLFAIDATGQDSIVELDPATGAVLASFDRPGTDSASVGLAYNGVSLFLSDTGSHALYEIDPNQGTVLNTIDLPAGPYDGVAALNDGLVYVASPNRNEILVVQPTTGEIIRTLEVTNDAGAVNIQGGLGEAPGNDTLLVLTVTDEIVEVDPLSGQVLSTISHAQSRVDAAIAKLGGEIYVGYGGVNQGIDVFDATGQLLRSLPMTSPVFGLAGYSGDGDGHRINVTDGGTAVADFRVVSTLSRLSGGVFDDDNQNGLHDAGELGFANSTVYLDLNDNGVLDEDEPFVVTDGTGQFEFADLPPQDYVVRQQLTAPAVQTSPTLGRARLFAVDAAAAPDEILELDPETGAILARFDRPGIDTSGTGLAYDGAALYVTDLASDTIYVVDPDTGVVSASFASPTGSADGLAALDGLLYVGDFATNDISVVDPVTRAVVRVLDMDAIVPGLDLNGGLGEAPALHALVATTASHEIVLIDPQTGQLLSQFEHGQNAFDVGVAGVGDELYVSFANIGLGVHVFDVAGELLRTLPTSVAAFGLAAGQPADDAIRIRLGESETVSGLEFGTFKPNLPPQAVVELLDPHEQPGQPIPEGVSLELSGERSTDPEQQPLQYLWDLDGDGIFGETGSAAVVGDEVGAIVTVDGSQLDGAAQRMFSLRVVDHKGLADESVLTVSIANQAPVIASLAPAGASEASANESNEARPNQEFAWLLDFRDASAVDSHRVEVSWGDGELQTIEVAAGDSRELLLSHTYVMAGVYQVLVRVTDDDGGLAEARRQARVLGIGVHEREEGAVVQVVGSAENDQIWIDERWGRLLVQATIAGEHQLLAMRHASRVEVLAGDGDDLVTITHKVDLPVVVLAGAGNDFIFAGGEKSIVFGGAGDDVLIGNEDENLLFGGPGDDRIGRGYGQQDEEGSRRRRRGRDCDDDEDGDDDGPGALTLDEQLIESLTADWNLATSDARLDALEQLLGELF
ncbi:MAG: PQQ-binding-like beta-propeller repeat protein [Planctomycetales bacterium]|nr:PQQ-binding-like beta-propeller repeat protein [Planctomycetales bacterium]